MTKRFKNVQRFARLDQRGITGLETAIVLIAFVVVASVFAFAVITTGLFSSEEASSSAKAGVESAKSSMISKGSVILQEAYSTGVPSAAGTTTVMTDGTNGDFLNEGVRPGDTIRNVTQGTSAVIAAAGVAPTIITHSALPAAWLATDTYEIAMNSISIIKFKVVPSPGAEPFSLASINTVVSYIDGNNNLNSTYLATIPFGGGADPFATTDTSYWTHNWLVGSGPGINIGDVVEFTLTIKNLAAPLTTTSTFSIEIVPQTGVALKVSRTTPLTMLKVMDMN